MLSAMLVLCALPAIPFVQEEEETPPPSAEQVASTCESLETALGPKTTAEDAKPALMSAVKCLHADVVERIDRLGLRHQDPLVREVAVEALARMDHPAALKALHEALKRDRKELQEAPPRYATLLKAIARHGKPESIPFLVEDLFQSPDRGVITARILGLGRIRSKKSVDELIRLMRSAPRPRVAEYGEELRLSLVVLTGQDKGTDQELWINWYGDHDKGLEIAPEPPELPKELQRRWTSYWGPEEPRRKKRRQ